MDHILWLARIFGPFFFIIGLWMIFRLEDIQKVWNSIRNTPGLFYIGGLLNLLIGLTVLSTYHSWTWGLPVLLTIIGWLMLLRGLLVLFAPEKVLSWTEGLSPFSKSWAVLPLVIGILLSWLAFT